MSRKALLFLKSLLRMSPNERPTCTEALKNQYFEGLDEEFVKFKANIN